MRRTLRMCPLLSGVALPVPANAQVAASPQGDGQLQDFVVTAQKPIIDRR